MKNEQVDIGARDELGALESELQGLFDESAAELARPVSLRLQAHASAMGRGEQQRETSTPSRLVVAETRGRWTGWTRWAMAAVLVAGVGAGGWMASMAPSRVDSAGMAAGVEAALGAGSPQALAEAADDTWDDEELPGVFDDPAQLDDGALVAAADLDLAAISDFSLE